MITTIDKNTALIVIDLQNGIVKYPTAHAIHEIIKNAAALVKTFRAASLPIVLVNVDPREMAAGTLRKDAKSPAMEIPDEWLQIVPEIEITAKDTLITKKNWNAFTNPELDRALRNKNVTGIVLAGVSTSIGVEGTARAANEHGYHIAFAIDAITDTNEDAHNHSLNRIFPRIGEVDTTANIIDKIKQP